MGKRALRGFDLEQPGAVGELVAQVQFAVVGSAGLPHFPDDFEPALAERAQGLGVGLTSLAQSAIIGGRPSALGAALVRKEMHGMAQISVAGPAHGNFVDLA